MDDIKKEAMISDEIGCSISIIDLSCHIQHFIWKCSSLFCIIERYEMVKTSIMILDKEYQSFVFLLVDLFVFQRILIQKIYIPIKLFEKH